MCCHSLYLQSRWHSKVKINQGKSKSFDLEKRPKSVWISPCSRNWQLTINWPGYKILAISEIGDPLCFDCHAKTPWARGLRQFVIKYAHFHTFQLDCDRRIESSSKAACSCSEKLCCALQAATSARMRRNTCRWFIFIHCVLFVSCSKLGCWKRKLWKGKS